MILRDNLSHRLLHVNCELLINSNAGFHEYRLFYGERCIHDFNKSSTSGKEHHYGEVKKNQKKVENSSIL